MKLPYSNKSESINQSIAIDGKDNHGLKVGPKFFKISCLACKNCAPLTKLVWYKYVCILCHSCVMFLIQDPIIIISIKQLLNEAE